MSRSRRLRHLALLPAAALLIPLLTACGEEQIGLGEETATGWDAVSVSGDVGKAPEVTWKSVMEVDKADEKTLVEGDGEKVADGDNVSVNLYIGNGTTKQEAYSTYKTGTPEELKAGDSNVTELLRDLLDGATYGSREAAVAPAEDMFGEAGNPTMGVAGADSLLVVVDVMEKVVPPKPVETPAAKMPKVVEKGGKVTGLDFTGVPKPAPDDDLKRTVLKQGQGAAATTESTLKVNYLGMVHGAKTPFDESYSKQPAEFALNSVVKGWTYGLEGMKAGARVLLAIPPSLGYGAQAQDNIPANSTLYFVVDVISVS